MLASLRLNGGPEVNGFPWLSLLIALPLVGAVATAALPQGHDRALPKQLALGVLGA